MILTSIIVKDNILWNLIHCNHIQNNYININDIYPKSTFTNTNVIYTMYKYFYLKNATLVVLVLNPADV